MSAIVLVDTSILLNVVDVPGFNQQRAEVLTATLIAFSNSVSKSFVSRREAAGGADARQGEVTTTRMI